MYACSLMDFTMSTTRLQLQYELRDAAVSLRRGRALRPPDEVGAAADQLGHSVRGPGDLGPLRWGHQASQPHQQPRAREAGGPAAGPESPLPRH